MSLFLAPIHTWLFDKIVLLENIERGILSKINDEAVSDFSEKSRINMGDFIPDAPIESIIDTSNIHGWLQGRINLAESRQASLVKFIADSLGQQGLDAVNETYKEFGELSSENITTKLTSSIDIFNSLNDFLLEGMPCDRVNSILEKTDELTKWETVLCVHRQNWEANDIAVENYYRFRASFIEGFVSKVSSGFNYEYSNDKGQFHRIYK